MSGLDVGAVEDLPDDGQPPAGGRKALDILQNDPRLRIATLKVGQKRAIAAAFAANGLPVPGQAFDAVSTHELDEPLDFKDTRRLREQCRQLVLLEVKATNRVAVPRDFTGFFFAITTGELLAAQKLGERYRFALVHLVHREVRLSSLRELMRRTKAIYPSWSVVLDEVDPADAARGGVWSSPTLP